MWSICESVRRMSCTYLCVQECTELPSFVNISNRLFPEGLKFLQLNYLAWSIIVNRTVTDVWNEKELTSMLISSDDDVDVDTYCHHDHSLLQNLRHDSVYRIYVWPDFSSLTLYSAISVSPVAFSSLLKLLQHRRFREEMVGKVDTWEAGKEDTGEWLLRRADIPPASGTVTSRNQGRHKCTVQR